ncbi:ester cyclase [Burkholderia sp. Ac-20345]|nr:ester cyclase [Burkholderia sp. Ac-20345]
MNVRKMAVGWLDRLQNQDSEEFARLFSVDGLYVDPAFGLVRRGRDFVKLHHRRWHAAVPDFRCKAERVLVEGRTATIQYEAEGTFSGESLGAGERIILPTHQSFRARGLIVLDYDESGQVISCTEYYDRSIMPCGEKPPFDDDVIGLR